MLKKILYVLALALSVSSARSAGLAAQDDAGGIQWRAPSYATWDYLEQRQQMDETSWRALPADEQKTMLDQAKQACAEAGKAVKLLSASPLDGDRLLEIGQEDAADAKACFKQEGKRLDEVVRTLNGIKARAESGTLTENDINWLEENNVSWAEKYKETYKYQALKPKIGEHTAKQQQQLDKFNAEGTGKKLSGITNDAKHGDSEGLDKFYDGGASKKDGDDLSAPHLSLKAGGMKTGGKTPEEQKQELMQKGAPPPALGGKAPDNPALNKASVKDGVTYQKIDGNLYSSSGKTGDIYTMAINQGQLGDCYFLSSAASIAKKDPDYIKDSIHENKDGTYSVDFYREKPWWKLWGPDYTKETVTVDNQFPVKDGSPEYNNSKGYSDTGKKDNMWGMVYEKAYAKFQGSYGAIAEGGWPSAAMAEITGKPSTTSPASSTSLDKITDWEKKGYAVTVGSIEKPSNAGVVGGHAYYIQSVDPVTKTVTLGNPWGFKNVTLTEAEFQANYSEVYVNPIH